MKVFEAPSSAVGLVGFELGLRKPQLAGRAMVTPKPVRTPAKKKARRRG